MSTTLFISDLHLDAGRPDIGEQFLTFLQNEASQAEALYILGDLFETWLGDDDPNEHYASIKQALAELVDSGVPVYFMHGNRDFLLGAEFAAETGVRILPDPYELDLHGTKVLLSHGDALCTDDIEYQQFREMSRNPEWQSALLAKSLEERTAFAADARRKSKEHNATKPEEIMDVNQGAVEKTITDSGADILLHGHTHRPALHDVDLGERHARRVVLGDWYDHGSVLRWDEDGFVLAEMPRT